MRKIIFVTLVIVIVNFVLGNVLSYYLFPQNNYVAYYAFKIIIKCFLIALTILIFYKNHSSVPYYKHNIFVVPIIVVLIFLPISSVRSELNGISEFNNILFFLSCLCVGVFEELFFRKYLHNRIQRLFKKHNLLLQAVITSLFFSLAHLTNLFNIEFKITIINQVLLAFGLGMLFQALLLKFKNIILIIGLHAIINYLGTYKSKLLFINREESAYTMNDFFIGLTFLTVVVFILFSVSYFIIRKVDSQRIDITTN